MLSVETAVFLPCLQGPDMLLCVAWNRILFDGSVRGAVPRLVVRELVKVENLYHSYKTTTI